MSTAAPRVFLALAAVLVGLSVVPGTEQDSPATVQAEVEPTPVHTADTRRLTTRPMVTVTAHTRPSGYPVGSDAYLRGRTFPTTEGTPVVLQQRGADGWEQVSVEATGADGRFRFPLPTEHSGSTEFRVVRPAADGRPRAVSPVREHRVHRVVTYTVDSRGTFESELGDFAREASRVLADRRGWAAADIRFEQVDSDGDFELVLAAAEELPSFGPPCHELYSCRSGDDVVINERNWRSATPGWKAAGGELTTYRQMVVNHEVGHWLGLGHRSCGGAGERAPVMMQQSKGLRGCEPNPWPLPREVRRVR